MDLSERILNDIKNNALPDHIRDMIIDDAMPMDADTRIKCLLYFSADTENYKDAAGKARETLNIIEQDMLLNFVKDQTLDKTLFKAIIQSLGNFDKVITSAITHKDFSPDLAGEILSDDITPVSTLELFSINQAMFYKYPYLIDILFNNKRITKEIADRLARYREGIIADERMKKGFKKGEEFKIANDYEIVFDEVKTEAPPEKEDEDLSEKIQNDMELIEEIYEEDQIFKVAQKGEEIKEPEEKEKEKMSIHQFIESLSVSAQIKLAVKGNKEVRAILIRNPKKIVAQAVLGNPKINEYEIEFYAKLRNLSEDIMRAIASNPDWIKKPSIWRALLYNPKTPPGLAISFLSRVTDAEVKEIARSKSLPQAIRIAAKRQIQLQIARQEKIRRMRKKH